MAPTADLSFKEIIAYEGLVYSGKQDSIAVQAYDLGPFISSIKNLQ